MGTPTTACEDSLFAFDVDLIYDAALSVADGSCAEGAMDASYNYGSYLMVGYGSGLYAWASASIEGENLHYANGLDDYPNDYGGLYPGYDYTHFTQGQARVYRHRLPVDNPLTTRPTAHISAYAVLWRSCYLARPSRLADAMKHYSAEPILDWFTLVTAATRTVFSSRWPQNWRRFKFLVLFTVLWPMLKVVALPCLMLDYVLYPGFNKIPVKEPLFIVGNWRTGSTMLYRNIARDTDNIACFTFLDAMLPAICLKRLVARLQRVDSWLGGWGARVGHKLDDLFLAEYSRIHPMGFMMPEEDEHALLVDLCSASMFELFPMVKRFRRLFFVDREMPRIQREFVMQRYAKLVRRQLYHQGQHKRFIAKNPLFTHKIQSLARHFPDAKFVHLVRNPVNTVVSTASLFHFVWHETGALPPAEQDMDTVLEFCHTGYQHAARCGGELDEGRWVNVRFQELIADPEGTIRMLWERFEWPLNPDLAEVLSTAAHRQKKWRNKHTYTPAQFGTTEAAIYDDFRYVYDEYGFPPPPAVASRDAEE